MTVPPTFRRAVRADLPVILRLLAQLDGAGAEPWPEAEAQPVWDRLAACPGYAIWLAELDGAVVGTFVLVTIDNLNHQGRPVGLVENVVVDPALRSRGIGEAMMRFAMERCRERRCYKLILSSGAARTDAHRFYDRIGFRRHGASFLVEL
jgi:GNAT superfamily N-acetyltransferase